MEETKMALKRLGLYGLLMILPILIYTDLIYSGPPFSGIRNIYSIALTVILTRYFYEKIADRGVMKRMLITISVLMLLWFVVGFGKVKFLDEVDNLKRFSWYLYYIPMIFIALLVFYTALAMDMRENEHIPKKWHWMTVVSIILCVMVLTNDLHQKIFCFNPGFLNWDNDYTHGYLFYILITWQYGLYLAAFITMIIRCRVGALRKSAWVTLIPFAIGIPLIICSTFDIGLKINNRSLLDVTSLMCFMVAAFLDSCITIGLIPSNYSHSEIFRYSSLAVQIADKTGQVVFASEAASDEYDKWTDDTKDYLIYGDTEVVRRKIRNGYGFWQHDISAINKLNEDLIDLHERLEEEGELTRLENTLKEKRLKIEARTQIYDLIAEKTKKQSEKIYKLADNTENDIDQKRSRLICVYGAYIKRYANLMLLSADNEMIKIMELGLAIQESLKYLNNYGIPCDYMGDSPITVKGSRLLTIYEVFEKLLEDNLDNLDSVYVRLLPEGLIKITLEGVSARISEEAKEKMAQENINWDILYEDEVTYIRIIPGKEEEL